MGNFVQSTIIVHYTPFLLAFTTGWDSATFQDKGTEVPSLSRDKGTTGQAQNLFTGQDGLGQPVKIQDGTRGAGRDNHSFLGGNFGQSTLPSTLNFCPEQPRRNEMYQFNAQSLLS